MRDGDQRLQENTSHQRKIYIFFPVYNEGASAGALADRVQTASRDWSIDYHILAVDDGSKDDSAGQLQSRSALMPLTVVSHETNQGLSQALKTGLVWLRGKITDDDLVVMMDGDDTHDPGQIKEMLVKLDDGADVVIASRYRSGSSIQGVPWYRQISSYGAAFVGMALFHVKGVRDYACGFRLIRGSVLHRLLNLYEDRIFEMQNYGFACSLELLLKLSDVTGRFAEIPMLLRYDRKKSSSKMNIIRTIKGYQALYFHRRKHQPPRLEPRR
jgi:dolichol-phosphate mannosyltransferase